MVRVQRALLLLKNYKNSFKRTYTTDLNVFKSKIPAVTIPNISISEYLWQNLSKWSRKVATVCLETNRQYTYEQLHRNSLALTRFLKDSLKLRQQNTVAVILPNLPEFPLVVIGALQSGLKVTTINPNYTSEEIAKQLVDSESRLVFCSNDLVPVVRGALNILKKPLPIVSVKHKSSDCLVIDTIDLNEIISGDTCDPVQIDPEDTAFLPYSSGTTGLSKGVQLTHNNIVANLSQFAVKQITPFLETTEKHQDVTPGLLPFFHCYGLILVMMNSLAHGHKIVTMPKFSSHNFIRMTKLFKPNVIFGVPSTVHMITNNPRISVGDLIGLRTIISAAAPLGASDIERFHQRTASKITILQAYGMTETSPLTSIQTDSLECGIKIGGSGVLIPNTEARIIPTDGQSDTVVNLPPHQNGEILLRGPQIMKGYYNNPQSTQDVFVSNGWLKTGDVGYYDEDGQLFITDRLKEFIKVKGFQVAPAELEAILRDHPHVEDAAVVGIEHQQFGEVPRAFIVSKPNVRIDKNDLIEFVARQTAKYKHLVGGVVLIDAIPKNPSGKILRRQLKQL